MSRCRVVIDNGVGYHPRGHGRLAGLMDTLTRFERSKRMALIRSKDTRPELLVRQIARLCGYRFRLHVSKLPGRPDLVFPKHRKVIFVHGCFWHRHYRCRKSSMPKTRVKFWTKKFEQNKQRDREQLKQLYRQGWKALILWECQMRSPDRLGERIRQYLETP